MCRAGVYGIFAHSSTCHVIMPKGHPDDAFMGKVSDELEHKFGISHATLQSELGTEEDCALEPAEVV